MTLPKIDVYEGEKEWILSCSKSYRNKLVTELCKAEVEYKFAKDEFNSPMRGKEDGFYISIAVSEEIIQGCVDKTLATT